MNINNKTISRLKFVIILFFYIFIFGQTAVVLATNNSATIFNNGLSKTGGPAGYNNSLQLNQAESNLTIRISQIISIALSFLGIIFLVLMIYSGYVWMTARGDETRYQKAKQILIDSIIGLIIVIAAYAISYFVISTLQTGTISIG